MQYECSLCFCFNASDMAADALVCTFIHTARVIRVIRVILWHSSWWPGVWVIKSLDSPNNPSYSKRERHICIQRERERERERDIRLIAPKGPLQSSSAAHAGHIYHIKLPGLSEWSGWLGLPGLLTGLFSGLFIRVIRVIRVYTSSSWYFVH